MFRLLHSNMMRRAYAIRNAKALKMLIKSCTFRRDQIYNDHCLWICCSWLSFTNLCRTA